MNRHFISRVIVFFVFCLFLGCAAHAVNAGVGSHDQQQLLQAQNRWLEKQLDSGAPQRMQALFPEGEAFQLVLTGLALAGDTERLASERAQALTPIIEQLSSHTITNRFGSNHPLPEGVFIHAWRLLVEVERARLSDNETDVKALAEHASQVAQAMDSVDLGFLESYPGQTWPVDTVVAAGALGRANRILKMPELQTVLANWSPKVQKMLDPTTGLLPHQITASGQVISGPRATSSSIMAVYWPDAAPNLAPKLWESYVRTFMDRTLGIVGIREYPHGVSGGGDVDSGPLIFGMSASATVVTLAAARTNGSHDLAQTLSREAELLGLPWQWGGSRWYAAGIMPVGDAFLAWARAEPQNPVSAHVPTPSFQWYGWALPPLLMAVLLAWAVLVPRRWRIATLWHRTKGTPG